MNNTSYKDFDSNLNRQVNYRKPDMPKTYNVCILGPHSSGKLSIAKKLAERYGWKLIHFPQILKDTVFK